MLIISKKQKGFTLLEVLVTLVIFAFGMLGVAGLQMVSLTNMDAAQNRSVATLKATEMAERIRANPNGGHSSATGANNSCRTAHYANRVAAPNNCTPTQMAQDDLLDWRQELAARLPSGTGTVCIDSTPNDGLPAAPACDGVAPTVAVKIWWTEKARSAAAVAPKRLAIGMVQ